MPDPQPNKRRPPPQAGLVEASSPAYAELHCKTNFSFLEGASHADELVAEAARLGYAALAVTDRNSLAGVVRAHVAAKEAGLPLLIGAEITPADSPLAVLLATDRAAYGRLARLITVGRRRAEKGECQLAFDDVAAHAGGLLALVLLPSQDDEANGRAVRDLLRYREAFGDRAYLLIELLRGPDDERRLEWGRRLARQSRLPPAAAGDVHYHVRDRGPLADVLAAIRTGTTVAHAGQWRFSNYERALKPPEEMALRFAQLPHAVRRTVEIAHRCRFSLDELKYEYPEELAPHGETPLEYLTRLAWTGARARYPNGIPDKVRTLVEHELELIRELRYEAYFLTVFDLVRFARRRGILCQGRGSAANSAVCYALGVTSVDPDQIDLLFERFVSRERNEAPDIDVDFEHERREEVLQYLYDKYGRERAGLTAEVITYRPRSAIRDVGKALGLSLDRIDALAKNLDGYHQEPRLAERCREAGVDPESPVGRDLVQIVTDLVGFPRHLSQHVGGMVMTRGPLCELVPIENAAMADRTVIQWDKDDLDDIGILKVDCLALGMLTAIRKAFGLVEGTWQKRLTLAEVPEGDAAVYDMICRADTMGVFQIESRAQMSMLPRLRPRCFYDLVIEVAIVRPGPIQGDMVHPYLRRRTGQEPVEFPSESIRGVLEKTLGVPLFQEQAMKLAVVAAGFTPGEADQLRRAMGAWRKTGVMDKFRQKLIAGMRERGYSQEFAEQLFRQIRGFGEYGFPESHAASFARLVYISAWLKHYYPAAFTASLINSQPMGFYAPAQLIRDARDHGVVVLPADVGTSRWDCTLEAPTRLRLGLRMVSGLAQEAADRIVAAREERPFASLADLEHRAGLQRSVLERLARADALGSLGLNRRHALWEALGRTTEDRPLFASLEDDEAVPAIPALSAAEEVLADYSTQGMSLRAHPLSFVRDELNRLKVARAADLATLPNGRWVKVAGLVLMRQRPSTASGITFVTLEDETGQANLIVRPNVWERYRPVARGSGAFIAGGPLQRSDGVIHVLVGKLEDLTAELRGLRLRSRDFR